MAISSAICNTFKRDLLKGFHDFDSSGGDTFKIALYTSSASLGASTTDYSATNEITNTSGSAYTAGGETLTNNGVTGGSGASTAYVDFADAQWTSASFTANGALIYNTTEGAGTGTTNTVVGLDFGADKTSTAGDFQIAFPTADSSNAIIRIA